MAPVQGPEMEHFCVINTVLKNKRHRSMYIAVLTSCSS